jgi:hypothetical protein
VAAFEGPASGRARIAAEVTTAARPAPMSDKRG